MTERPSGGRAGRAAEQASDWEIYTTPSGYRAELFRGADPTCLAVIRSHWRPTLYARMLVAQWRHR